MNWKEGNVSALVDFTGSNYKKKEQKIKKSRNKYNVPPGVPKKYRDYFIRAFKKKLDFELSVERFLQICNLPCSYCGGFGENGIDRIDSSLGYVEENSQPCCSKCNMMKLAYTHEDFINHLKKVLTHLNL